MNWWLWALVGWLGAAVAVAVLWWLFRADERQEQLVEERGWGGRAGDPW